MKTKEQVVRYVADSRFNDEDWKLVSEYCTKEYGKNVVRRGRNNASPNTYGQFLDWLENGYPSGEIVRYGNTLGIVGGNFPDVTYLSAFLDLDMNAVISKIEVSPEKIFGASKEEKDIFRAALYEAGFEFDNHFQKIVECYKPKNGSFVQLKINDKECPGIWKTCDKNGAELYCLLLNEELKIDYCLSLQNIDIEPVDNDNLMRLQKSLIHNKLEWSARTLSFIPAKTERAEKGGRYWYLTDKFTITSEEDNRGYKQTGRYKAGNYFSNYSEALYFLAKVLELRKEISTRAF